MAKTEFESPKYINIKDRQQQLDMILHLQEFSSMLIYVAGEEGVGKSQFLHHVHDQLEVHHQTILIEGAVTQSESQLVSVLADNLACLASLESIEVKLENLQAVSETLHVLVDDAHLLSVDALEILLAKALSNNGWHLILAGGDKLEESLESFQEQLARDDIFHKIELLPLSLEQATEFISGMYSSANVIPFSSKKIQNIWQLSSGLPSKILEIIDHEQRVNMQLVAKLPLGHVAAVCLIAIALTFSYLYQQDTNSVHDQDAIADLLAGKQVLVASGLGGNENVANVVSEMVTPKENLERTEVVQKNESAKDEVVVSLPVKPKEPISVNHESIAVAKVVKNKTSTLKPIDHKLLNAAANSYALQLLGVRSRDSAQQFVDRFSRELNVSKLDIYETKYKGQPWFVVVYGPFSNKDIANKEAGDLSKTLKSQPWIRPISKIQEDIRQLQVH